MENEKPEVTDKTYTLNSETSYFNTEKINLDILLPLDDMSNPYQYTVFDVSQDIEGEKFNALFVYMKKRSDNGDDLSGSDDDTSACNCFLYFSDVAGVPNLPNASPFDTEYAEDALVMVYHDMISNSQQIASIAEAAYDSVKDATTAVRLQGNFQTTMSVMGGEPKKVGMSLSPRR